MSREVTGYLPNMDEAPEPDTRPRALRRCARCPRPSDVLVEDERGLVATACVDHLEWAFLTGVDTWTGRWRTA